MGKVRCRKPKTGVVYVTHRRDTLMRRTRSISINGESLASLMSMAMRYRPVQKGDRAKRMGNLMSWKEKKLLAAWVLCSLFPAACWEEATACHCKQRQRRQRKQCWGGTQAWRSAESPKVSSQELFSRQGDKYRDGRFFGNTR